MIFIHGLGGDAFSTWRYSKDNSDYWLHWLGQEFPDVGVWSLGYAASPTKWTRFLGWFSDRWRDAGYTMALPDRASQVLNLMEQRGLGRRPLLLICHSLGGLLAKQILRKAADASNTRMNQVCANTRAVLFLATPHAGADLASLVTAFRSVFGATVSIEDLRAHDAHLRDLYDWYRNHAPGIGIETVTYYEMRPVRGILPIVKPAFAHPGIGADPVPLDEDHLSIAKPRSRDAQAYAAARDLLANYVLANKPGRESPPQFSSPGESRQAHQEVLIKLDASAIGSREARIPHELPPAAEAFFGRSTELNQLTARLRQARNTAVVGPAGLGKTALAAQALHEIVGDNPRTLAASPFPDGVVFLDLYTLRGQCELAWNTLANKLAGAGFMDRSAARERATQACSARRILIIIEGGEEADGNDGRCGIDELLGVLSPQNRRLLLTRLSTQAARSETVELKEALQPDDAALLLDSLTMGRLEVAVRERLLGLLEGHPLALTWAGNLVALDDDDPKRLVDDWSHDRLPKLSDATRARHTLEWLFERSVRGLDNSVQQVLAAAGLLSRAPFPLAAMGAALGNAEAEQIVHDALKSLVHRGLLRRSEETEHWEFTHVLGYRFARKETGTDPALRTRMAHWLREHIVAVLEAASNGDDTLSLALLLQHTDALMRADDDQRLWMSLINYLLYDASDRLVDLGRLDVVKLNLDGVANWMERFPSLKLQEPYWLREWSVSQNKMGDVLRDQGDLDGALAAFRESLAVSQRLASADPSYAGWQRDLSVSLNKLGDVLRAQGDLDGALAAFRESLAVRQRLASADPSNAGWQRDLSFSLTRLAEFHDDEGKREEALRCAEESLKIDERLAALDPTNATWQKDVAVSRALIARLRAANTN